MPLRHLTPKGVAFPKMVILKNPRLLILHWISSFVMFSLVVGWYFGLQQWARRVAMGPHIEPGIWVIGAGDKAFLRRAAKSYESKEVCTTPENFDFLWDEAGEWLYSNHTCMKFCDKGGGGSHCIDPKDTYVQESSTQIFFTTQVMQHRIDLAGTPEPDENYFMPTAEALKIGLSYRFKVPKPSYGVESAYVEEYESGSSSEDILTVVQDSNGKNVKRLEPRTEIVLSVSEALSLAGDANMLDTHDENIPNLMPNRSAAIKGRGAPKRVVGIDLSLNINCQDGGEGWKGPVCYVRFTQGQLPWANLERLDRDSRGTLYQNLHGIRIRCRTAGIFKFFDIGLAIMGLSTSLVLLHMPLKFVLFVATSTLGHVSKMYDRVIFERFSMRSQIGGLITRLMAQNVSFLELADTENSEQQHHGISRRMVKERLRELLRFREDLDDGEIEQITEFCFRSVLEPAKEDKETFSALFKHALGPTSPKSKLSKRSVIGIDEFCVACSSHEPIDFEAIVTLFDCDRPIGRLERFFTPPNLIYALEKTKSVRAAIDPTPLGSSSAKVVSDCDGVTRVQDITLRCNAGDADDANGKDVQDISRQHTTSSTNSVMDMDVPSLENKKAARDMVQQSLQDIAHVAQLGRSLESRMANKEKVLVARLNDQEKALEERLIQQEQAMTNFVQQAAGSDRLTCIESNVQSLSDALVYTQRLLMDSQEKLSSVEQRSSDAYGRATEVADQLHRSVRAFSLQPDPPVQREQAAWSLSSSAAMVEGKIISEITSLHTQFSFLCNFVEALHAHLLNEERGRNPHIVSLDGKHHVQARQDSRLPNIRFRTEVSRMTEQTRRIIDIDGQDPSNSSRFYV